MAAEQAKQQGLRIPMGVVTLHDVGRLTQEAEAVDNFLQAASVRHPGTSVQLPKTSNLFDELVQMNKLNLLQETDRQTLAHFLEQLHLKAPTLHMSFSTDPSPMFQQRLITWIRQNMHPYMLIRIGMQPSIGAGCMVRGASKFYDFSLRQRFKDKRGALVDLLHIAPQATAAQPAQTQVKEEAAA